MLADGDATSAERRRKNTGVRSKPRLLIVDDDYDNRAICAQYLRHYGWDVKAAKNGREALAVVATYLPRAIVMDLKMSVLGGIATMEHLKRDVRTKDLPVVVLTAFADHERQARAAGCVAFLIKPCLPETLRSVLMRVLRETRAPRATVA